MTATNVYFSTNTPQLDRPYSAVTSNATGGASGSLNAGTSVGVTSVRAADFFELRMMVYSTGTTKTNITKKDFEDFVEVARRWVYDPVNGLDAVISNASIAAPIP